MKSVTVLLLTFVFNLFIVDYYEAQTVYITKTGKKYHTKKCRQVKKSGTEIELKKALEDGYKACPTCGADKIKPQEESSDPKRKEKVIEPAKGN